MIFFSFILFCLCSTLTGLDRLQTESLDGTAINISNSSSASFVLPTASSLSVSGIDDETVDIRASKQLLSDSIWSTTYFLGLVVLDSFYSEHTSTQIIPPVITRKLFEIFFLSKKRSLILIAWSWLNKLRRTESLNSPSHYPLAYTPDSYLDA